MRIILTIALAMTTLSIGGVGSQAKEPTTPRNTNSAWPVVVLDRNAGNVHVNRAEPKCSVFGSYIGPCER